VVLTLCSEVIIAATHTIYPPNIKTGIQYSYSLPTQYALLLLSKVQCNILGFRKQWVCRKILPCGSRNNLNLHFKLAIHIRQNKCDHLGLLLYALSFIQFCVRKLLLTIVGLVLKYMFNYRVFSTKLYAHEMFESREFRTILGSLQKVFAGT